MNAATCIAELKAHPAAELFPLLNDAELTELAKDIKENGLLIPIVLHEGLVLDGRNRLKACAIAGVEPTTVTWTGTGSATAWILSINVRRRHLSPTERAVIAAKSIPLFEAEARERMLAGQAIEDGEHGRAAEKVAEIHGVSKTAVYRAKSVLDHATPELAGAMARGEVAVRAAYEVASLPAEQQAVAVQRGTVAAEAKRVRAAHRSPVPAPPSSERSAETEEDRAPHGEQGLSALTREREETLGTGEEAKALRDLPSTATAPQAAAAESKPEHHVARFERSKTKGTSPADEHPRILEIVRSVRSAASTWRWLVLEWNEEHRDDMRFALARHDEIWKRLSAAMSAVDSLSNECAQAARAHADQTAMPR